MLFSSDVVLLRDLTYKRTSEWLEFQQTSVRSNMSLNIIFLVCNSRVLCLFIYLLWRLGELESSFSFSTSFQLGRVLREKLSGKIWFVLRIYRVKKTFFCIISHKRFGSVYVERMAQAHTTHTLEQIYTLMHSIM